MTRIYSQPARRWFGATHSKWGQGYAVRESWGYVWFNGLGVTLDIKAPEAAQVLKSERDAQGQVQYVKSERADELTALESFCHKD